MEPTARTLRLYTQPSELPPVDWAWADEELRAAGTYWVVPPTEAARPPHPRPVWGTWADGRLALSIGSPVVRRLLPANTPVTVHLDSGTDVVLVEGVVTGTTEEPAVVAAYDTKYDWTYDLIEYGPFTVVAAATILAWRTAGWAGRESFQQTARWTFS
jgi:hypothetical protein